MKHKILITLFFASSLSYSQPVTFQKAVGGASNDLASSVKQTSDKGYIIAGTTVGNDDVYLVKMDSLGITQWTKTYGGTGIDQGFSVQQTTDGGYVVAGYTESFGTGGSDANMYLIKTDANGVLTWSKSYGDSYDNWAYSVQQTTDGGYILGGYKYSTTGNFNYSLVKTDANGNQVWSKTYGGSGADHGKYVIQTADGGFIIAGKSYSFGPNGTGSVYVVKTDANGNLLWSNYYGSVMGGVETFSIRQTADGGFVISTSTFDTGDSDACIIKTDNSGNVIWSKSYDIGGGKEHAHSVKQTMDGGYIILGYADEGTSFGGFYAVKTNSLGVLQWSKVYNGSDGLDVIQTLDGGYAFTGYGVSSSVLANGYEFLLIKTDNNGNSGCADITPSTTERTPPMLYGPCATVTVSVGSDYNALTSTGTGLGSSSTICSSTSIHNFEAVSNDITISPNPSNGNITLKNTSIDKIDSIEIEDALGKKVYSTNSFNNANEINFSFLQSGIYYLKIQSKGNFQTEKIIIQ